MLVQGKLDYSKAQPLPAGNWKALRSASAVLATNTTDSYVFVVINTGGQSQNGSLNSPTQVGFRIAAYDKTSTGEGNKAPPAQSYIAAVDVQKLKALQALHDAMIADTAYRNSYHQNCIGAL